MFVFFKILNYETTRRDSRGSGVIDAKKKVIKNAQNEQQEITKRYGN